MRIIQKHRKSFLKVINHDDMAALPYRKYTYSDELKIKDGLLLFNYVTDEVLLLENSDFTTGSVPSQLDLSLLTSACRDYLLSHRFLVNKTNEDYRDVEKLRHHLKLLDQVHFKGFQRFTILTTTDCNARCYYCYEKGLHKKTMDEKTAMDTADYIIKNCSSAKAKEVGISWFGGEPLCNDKVIDIISRKLTAAGIVFFSSMITNGLLLDAEKCRKAVEFWKLQNIQITIDGTEKTYNRTKAYINDAGNAFQTVIANVQSALDAGIEVTIRLNISKSNIDDMFLLADELAAKFPNKKPYVYESILIQYNAKERIADKNELEGKLKELKEKLNSLGLIPGSGFFDKTTTVNHTSFNFEGLRLYQCMADNPSSIVILPDGKLHACEHIDDALVWGSIYTDENKYDSKLKSPLTAEEVSPFVYWSENKICNECRSCQLYPLCVRILHCPAMTDQCQPDFKDRLLTRLEHTKQHFVKLLESSNRSGH